MPRAYHPVFRDVSEEITDAQKDDYKAAGWRLSPLPEFDQGGVLPKGTNVVKNATWEANYIEEAIREFEAVKCELVRQVGRLLKERDEARAEIERWRVATAKLRDGADESARVATEQLARAEAELAALRRDKERLDWLEASPPDRLAEVRRLLFLRCETARESIDAAMKGGANG